jgi:hypothetical protein
MCVCNTQNLLVAHYIKNLLSITFDKSFGTCHVCYNCLYDYFFVIHFNQIHRDQSITLIVV